MRAALLVLVAVGAVGGRAAAEPAIPAGLIVYGHGGLRVGGETIVKTPVDAAAYDPAVELIWFVSAHQLKVVDLRVARHPAVVIARGLTGDELIVHGVGDVRLYHGDAQYIPDFELDYDPPGVTPFDAQPNGMGDESHGQNPELRAVRAIKIVGRAWIAAQQHRASNPVAARAKPAKLVLPKALACPDWDDRCGAADWLGDSPYEIVTVHDDCSTSCTRTCALYAPDTKQFATTLAAGTWGALAASTPLGDCEHLVVEPGSARYAGAGKVCALGATITCADLGAWTPVAWLAVPHAPP